MKNSKLIGMIIFVLGILILLGYGLYEGFQNISLEELDLVISSGVLAIIVGLVILFISIVFEQQEGKKKMKDEIKKEDLEP